MRYKLILCLLFLFSISSYAQKDTLTFAKGRVITSLYGSISNQKVKLSDDESHRTTGYTIGTKSGVFIKDNWVLGVNFSLTKSELSNVNVNIDNEELLLGLWSRLYFAKKGSGVLYAELTPYFTSVNMFNAIQDDDDDDDVIIANEEISGTGFGVIPGFGFAYVINKNVGFGMTLTYPLGKINIDTEDLILDNTVSSSYTLTQLQFSFNFQIYLDQFFF